MFANPVLRIETRPAPPSWSGYETDDFPLRSINLLVRRVVGTVNYLRAATRAACTRNRDAGTT